MIIATSEDGGKTEGRPEPVATIADDPPPIYTPQTIGRFYAVVPSSPHTRKVQNFISIQRGNGSITGSWTIDPHHPIPVSLRPPLGRGETEAVRKNLDLRTGNGSIDVDITLPPLLPLHLKQAVKRTTLSALSSNGGITMRLHTSDNGPRPPFYLNMFTSNGALIIHIPRSFHGPLILKSGNGYPSFSAAIIEQLSTFSDVHKTRRCFIGDYTGLKDEEKWEGDEMVVETANGPISVIYDDEVLAGATVKIPRKGFFAKLFGF